MNARSGHCPEVGGIMEDSKLELMPECHLGLCHRVAVTRFSSLWRDRCCNGGRPH